MRTCLVAVVVALALGGCCGDPWFGCPGPCPCPCVCTTPCPAVPQEVRSGRAEDRDARALAAHHGRGSPAIWSFLAATYDADRDGRIAASEYPRKAATFQALDRDHDGVLTKADFAGPTDMESYIADFVWRRIALAAEPAPAPASDDAAHGKPPELTGPSLAKAFARVDADGNGRVGAHEVWTALQAAQRTPTKAMPDFPAGVRPFPSLLAVQDADHDGALTLAEVEAWRVAAADEPEEPAPDPEKAKARRRGVPVGETAPDFRLRTRDGKEEIALSSFRGEKPVVLIFGSWTCPPFRHAAPRLKEIVAKHRDRVQFLFVYVKEAHAVDGRAPMPSEDQPLVEEPVSDSERADVAVACAVDLGFVSFPTVVDGIDDATNKAYFAAPVRIYLVAKDGKVAYLSAPGPFGLDPDGLEKAIEAELAR